MCSLLVRVRPVSHSRYETARPHTEKPEVDYAGTHSVPVIRLIGRCIVASVLHVAVQRGEPLHGLFALRAGTCSACIPLGVR